MVWCGPCCASPLLPSGRTLRAAIRLSSSRPCGWSLMRRVACLRRCCRHWRSKCPKAQITTWAQTTKDHLVFRRDDLERRSFRIARIKQQAALHRRRGVRCVAQTCPHRAGTMADGGQLRDRRRWRGHRPWRHVAHGAFRLRQWTEQPSVECGEHLERHGQPAAGWGSPDGAASLRGRGAWSEDLMRCCSRALSVSGK